MSNLILHMGGAYQLYSTISDCSFFDMALTRDQLTEYIREELGEAGIRELPNQLTRAHRTGCSHILGRSLAECIAANRTGPGGSTLPFDKFVARYLTLCPEAPPMEPGERLAVTSIRLTQRQRATLKRIGAKVLREWLDRQ